jgi:hypothetical protein
LAPANIRELQLVVQGGPTRRCAVTDVFELMVRSALEDDILGGNMAAASSIANFCGKMKDLILSSITIAQIQIASYFHSKLEIQDIRL